MSWGSPPRGRSASDLDRALALFSGPRPKEPDETEIFFDKAKKTVDDRGGVQSLEEDAEELKKVATGKGSLGDKAKDAAAAIKKPGASGEDASKEPKTHVALTHQRTGNPVFVNRGQVTYWQGRGTRDVTQLPWPAVARIPTPR